MSVRKLAIGRCYSIALSMMLLLLGGTLPASASFWGRTNQPISLNGVAVPTGRYIPIWWDGGNFYYAGPYADADHIPKSAVEIVPRWVVRGEGPAEWSNTPCSYYAVQSNPVRAENALLPDDLKTYPPNGHRAHIVYKEGDSYGIQWGEPTPTEDYVAITRRVPADCVRFPPGHPFKGLISYVPLRAPGEMQEQPTDWDMSHHLGLLALIPLGIVGIFILARICARLVFRLAR